MEKALEVLRAAYQLAMANDHCTTTDLARQYDNTTDSVENLLNWTHVIQAELAVSRAQTALNTALAASAWSDWDVDEAIRDAIKEVVATDPSALPWAKQA